MAGVTAGVVGLVGSTVGAGAAGSVAGATAGAAGVVAGVSAAWARPARRRRASRFFIGVQEKNPEGGGKLRAGLSHDQHRAFP